VTLHDEIRGDIEMQDNFMDTVLLKQTGIPTYHLAHVVDDHLMRTTHVMRGDEWLPSYPLHVQLTQALGFTLPKYVHISPLCKTEGGNKRKLSKRKDPEANVEFFFQKGYMIEALADYMFGIMDSRFEAWRLENPTADYKTYPLTTEKLPLSGALFDIVKLDSIANATMTRISTEELQSEGLVWARQYDPELAHLMETYPDLTYRALDIERHTEKDPRRFTTFSDLRGQLQFFYEETFEVLKTSAPVLPECITPEIQKAFVEDYLKSYDPKMERDVWFEQLKNIAHVHGFARTGEEWKTGEYRGKTGDIAMMLRLKLCASAKTPDLCYTMRVL
jgi:glutamyl-tRNA synthetase